MITMSACGAAFWARNEPSICAEFGSGKYSTLMSGLAFMKGSTTAFM